MEYAIPDSDRFLLDGALRGMDRVDWSGVGTVLDVGSHVGIFAIESLKRGANFVIAVEPNPLTYEMLIHNLKVHDLWGKIVPLPFAVSDESFVKTDLYKAGTNEGQMSVMFRPEKYLKHECVSISLFDLLRMCPQIDLLKMDIEGGEWRIFDRRHETEIIETFSKVRNFYFEIHSLASAEYFSFPEFDADEELRWLDELFERMGFEIVTNIWQGTQGERFYRHQVGV